MRARNRVPLNCLSLEILLFFGFFVFSSLSFAQIKVPPTQAFMNEVVQFEPEDGHHFEIEAEQQCENGNVIEKQAEKVSCQLLKKGVSKVTLNVCDDKKTFCKANLLQIEVRDLPEGVSPEPLKPGLIEMKETLHSELLPGFVSGSLTKMKEMAQTQPKPVFLMISTDWCPPCNQSKEYLLGTKDFQDFSKDFFKVYVDGDSSVSEEYDKEVSFSEYPSFILLNSDFVEVARYREEYALSPLKDWWQRVSPYMDSGYAVTKQIVLERKEERWLRRILDFVRFNSEAIKKKDLEYVLEVALAKNDGDFLSKITSLEVPQRLLESWYSSQKDRLIKEGMSEVEYKQRFLEASKESPTFAYRLADVCGEKVDGKKLNACEQGEKLLLQRESWVLERDNRSRAENLGFLADEFYAQMSFYKGQDRKSKALEAAKSCTRTFEELLTLSSLKVPRYGMQGIMACAKEFDLKRVEKVYRNLIEKYPEDPTFIYRYARFLKSERKDLDRAKVWAEKSLKASYDFNWFYAASLYVDILKSLGQTDKAKSVIQEGFARLKLDQSQDSRSQKVLARLRVLEREIERK
ncbi:thioredoxin family protein [bacterium]|nr:thioredoxin family protein [bacterium]